jgi:chromosome segregation ATPase
MTRAAEAEADLIRGTKDELLTRVAALEQEAQEAGARLREAEERAAALADELAETDGRAKLARRALADFEALIAEQRQALAAVEEYERACEAVEAAARDRDEAAGRVAVAATAILDHLDELATMQAAVESAHTELVHRFGQSAYELPPLRTEPQAFVDALAALRLRLGEGLREEIQASLDEELLEAAARSQFANAINMLPPRLQEAGRRRWRERRLR